MELYQDVDYRPIVFIRFNPDDYTFKSVKIPSCWSLNPQGILMVAKKDLKEWESRLSCLKEQVNYWIKNESDKSIEVIHLYYNID
jgi:hypothetical protein